MSDERLLLVRFLISNAKIFAKVGSEKGKVTKMIRSANTLLLQCIFTHTHTQTHTHTHTDTDTHTNIQIRKVSV